LHAIACKAIRRKTGARGLRSILEACLLNVMFDLPSRTNVKRVILNEASIEGKSEPVLVFEEPVKAAGEKKTSPRKVRDAAA
jgi:ATP-dependent Clp protease ATP-binding subunit ClpX